MTRQSSRRVNEGWFRFIHSAMLSFSPPAVSRGLAIGLFWAFMPMPLQMIPAIFFCWLAFGNVAIAIICVWITNPITYVPIFYLEYKVGEFFFCHDCDLSFEAFAALMDHPGTLLQAMAEVWLHTLQGALILSIPLACVGYALGPLFSRRLTRGLAYYRKRRHAPHSR